MGAETPATENPGITFSKKPSYYAELRYYKPQSYRPILTAGLQLGNAMKSAKLEQVLSKSTSLPALPALAPVPVLIQHKPDRVGGPLGGDVHGSSMNPGFGRNALGGFYTQIR